MYHGFGPSHGFWLFAFERYNGLMGKQPNNNRSIEVQFMQRFIDNHKPLPFPNEHQKEVDSELSELYLKRYPRLPPQHLIALVQGTNGP